MHQIKTYVLTALCACALGMPAQAQQNPADKPTAIDYMNRYQFDQAEELINDNIKRLKRRRQPTTTEEEQLQEVQKMRSMMRATERLTVIDSIVVDKKTFLNSIKLSEESGTLHTCAELFHQTDSDQCTAYVSELGNKTYFAQRDESKKLRLYTSDLVGGEWSQTRKISELEGDEAQNYPFMMSDGVTLYYAAKGSESIGGYDIFVTRYDMDENKFLYPENLGMPYNSPANDYMLAIDEFNGLGWFASDRNQPEGKVCIYVFIPNDIRKVYDTNIYPPEDLAPLALLTRIADTWGDQGAVKEARQRLQAVLTAPKEVAKKKDFEFVIDDKNTYTLLTDFQSREARDRMAAWIKNRQTMQQNQQQLQALRDHYAASNDGQRQALAPQIRQIEAQCEKDLAAMKAEEKAIRNLEIASRSKDREPPQNK